MIYFTDLLQDNKFRNFVQNYLQQKSKNTKYRFEESFPKLFHYGKLSKHLIHDIMNQKLTLSSIHCFNDVFDSTVQIYNTDEEIDKAAIKRMQEDEKLGIEIDGEYYKEFFQEESKLKFSLLDYLGTYVSCFSTLNNSTLMWSHYADSNKGICVEYDFNYIKNNTIKSMLFPVLYTEQPLCLQELFEDGKREITEYPLDTAVLCSVLDKSNVWEYEHEWRMIFLSGLSDKPKRREIKININPSAVYIGNSFLKDFFEYEKPFSKPCEKITLLLELLEYIEIYNIQLYFMLPQEGSFNLKAKSINVSLVKNFIKTNFNDFRTENIRFYYTVYKQFLTTINKNGN